jgi:single-strand DNA-binding protein
MASMNKVQIIGHLGADPEVRYTAAGDPITGIRVAATEKWRDKQTGETKESTEWFRVTFFGRLAEIASEYLKKGSLVYIEGKLKTEEYEKDGIKRYATKVIAGELKMLGGREDGGGQRRQQEQPRQQQSAPRQAPQQSAPPSDFYDDDIPFN